MSNQFSDVAEEDLVNNKTKLVLQQQHTFMPITDTQMEK